MMDIDEFKSYNDAFGYPAGDQLLKDLCKILEKYFRETDIICRYAGDEFAIILPDTDGEGAKQVAEKIKKFVEQYPFKRKVTLSQGIAQYAKGMTSHDLILKADQALYQAKHGGKNRICAF